MRLPTRDEIEIELARRSLAEFIRQAWHVVEPARRYVEGRHIEVICSVLEQIDPTSEAGPKELVVNIPPRFMKSLTVSVFWPAWLWGPRGQPHLQLMCGSYALQLAVRDNLKRRRLITSSWYRERWGHVFRLTGDQNAKTRYENDANGVCLVTSPDSAATGEGGDLVIFDDPHNVKEAAYSETERQNVIIYWDESLSTRLNDPKTGVRVIIAQRCHEADLCGHVLAAGDAYHVCLPNRYEIEHPHLSELDWRTEPGELLWPERFGETQTAKLEKELGSHAAAGQLQQRPAPAEGGIVKRDWIRYYDALPAKLDCEIVSWDMSFKDTRAGSFVVGQCWGKRGADNYLIDQVRGRWDFVKTQDEFVRFADRHPNALLKLVEDKANGPAIISSLRRLVTGLVPVQVSGSKEARLAAVSPTFEAGNVHLPKTHWIAEYVEELTTFPNAANDDQVDTTSQALERLGRMQGAQGSAVGGQRTGSGYVPR